MNENFLRLIESLEPSFQKLLTMDPPKYAELPRHLPIRGVYLFSENGQHLYVGRTNKLRQRLRGHCIASASHFTATFAFRIARNETGRLKATYKTAGSRQDLTKDPVFKQAFEKAKSRVASMEIRYVEETNPTRQALLEIYIATVLETPYNDFDTH